VTIAELAPRNLELLNRRTDSWVAVLADVAALAKEIADTDFVPRGLRRNPPAITATMMYGRELGLGPMQSLRQIHMIEGKPALAAEAKRALALAAGHAIEYGETTGTTCTVRGRRSDTTVWHTVTWTMDMAQRAGIASKQVWKAYPRAMLKARATGELCGDLFPDVVGGFATVEEFDVVLDGGDSPELAVAAPEKPTRTVTRKQAVKPAPAHTEPPPAEPAAQAMPDPQPDPDPAPPPVPEAAPPPRDVHTGAEGAQPPSADTALDTATNEQGRKVFALLGDIWKSEGLKSSPPRPWRLTVCEALLGHRLDTFTDLTRYEASQLIDTLGTLAEGPEAKPRLNALVEHYLAAATPDQDAEFQLIAEVEGELLEGDDEADEGTDDDTTDLAYEGRD
jgi:hypothetical protein